MIPAAVALLNQLYRIPWAVCAFFSQFHIRNKLNIPFSSDETFFLAQENS
jgi:hypothetical protein